VISPGNVLVVDDEQAFFETYRDILAPEGYRVEWARDRESALARLQESPWDIVVLDQRLSGATGGDTGIDLVSTIVFTGAKVIVATAYADPAMIERAFRDGAYDYLEKNTMLRTLLRLKVRNAEEALRERRLASLGTDAREEELRRLWADVQSEPDRNRKGKLLEDLMVLLFKTVPGFTHVDTRRKSQDEEIDLFIRNESTDAFWIREHSQYVIVECKNWSKPVGPNELVIFRNKVENRGGRCRLGFFISVGDFTAGFHSQAATYRKADILIVPVERADLEELVNASDRNEVLKKLHARAAMAGNGNGH
jgi:CheY-like chemotaxis protein